MSEQEPLNYDPPAALEGTRPQAVVRRMMPVGSFGVEISSLSDLWRFSQMMAASGLAPKGVEKPEAIAVAIQLGLELGLPPMSALQNIAVINGKPGIYGDAALALVQASGLCEYIREFYEGEGESRRAVCITKRRGAPAELRQEFTVVDAKVAQLWKKGGPWTFYPDRMLRFRARGFNLRDNFPDVLKGVRTVEELQDIEVERVETAAEVERGEIRAAVEAAVEPGGGERAAKVKELVRKAAKGGEPKQEGAAKVTGWEVGAGLPPEEVGPLKSTGREKGDREPGAEG